MYWDQVLKEVLNRGNAAYPCVFTNLNQSQEARESDELFYRHTKLDELRVYLGKLRQGVYFTRRECQCMLLVLEGNTMKESGSKLRLSPRTIEYYVKNMKSKTKVRTRSELIHLVLNSDFMRNVKKVGLL